MGSSATHTFIGERRWRHRSRPFSGLLPLPLLHEKCPAAAQRHGCRSPRAAPELSDEGVGQFLVINAPSQWLCSTCNVKIKPVHKLAAAPPRQEDCRSEERQKNRCPPPHHQPRCERCDQDVAVEVYASSAAPEAVSRSACHVIDEQQHVSTNERP